MSKARSRAKEPRLPAASSPPVHNTRARAKERAAVADEETIIPTSAVKTDHEILSVALRDIGLINDALSSRDPITKLKRCSNVMAAYRDFMRKGRQEENVHRSWEHTPNAKLFSRGIHNFSRYVQDYSSWAEEFPEVAKDYGLSQYLDADPKVFGTRKATKEMLRNMPKQAA